jgi:hypothetical protein
VAFEEYQYDRPFQLACLICMAGSAWLYLRMPGRRGRWLALLGASAAATAVIALGKWWLVPLQDWPQWFQYLVYALGLAWLASGPWLIARPGRLDRPGPFVWPDLHGGA